MEPVKLDTGIWKCPFCEFTAMSRKVVENHMRTTHNVGALPKSEGKTSKKPHPKQSGQKRRVGPGGTKKRPIKTRNDVMRELYHDYTFELLHNKKAIVYVRWGDQVREFRGLVHARDPYTILLDTENGERWIILKGQIIAYKVVEGT